MNTTTLPADLCRRLVPLSDPKSLRETDNSIWIEPLPAGGATLTCTQGCALGSFHAPGAIAKAPIALLLTKELRKLLSLSEPGDILTVSPDGDNPTTSLLSPNNLTKGQCFVLLSNSSIPGWRRVIPRPEGAGVSGVSFNLDILNRFAKISDAKVFSLHSDSPRNPHLLLFPDRPDFLGVAMPRHEDHDTAALPDWLTTTPAAPADQTKTL